MITTQTEDTKVNVGVSIPPAELEEMKRMLCIDLSGPAVLAMARKGVAAEKEKLAKLAENDLRVSIAKTLSTTNKKENRK